MTLFCRMLICALALLMINNSCAADRSTKFYRNFWLPTYHGERLNYCTVENKECGKPVATRYCRMMGYSYSDHYVIDYNVGLTNYIAIGAVCKGWLCNGFKTIRCVSHLRHKPPRPYHYRLRKYVYPYFDLYRVAWCYDGRRGCGRLAAFSFCRRMGYLTTRRFAIEESVAATKAVGNQKLCFGRTCNAFKYITCYR